MVIQEPVTVPDEDPAVVNPSLPSAGPPPRSLQEESATVEPQSRVSDRSRSPQSKESPQKQKGKKTMAEVKKPSDLPKAKKHKPVNSEEDDEEPQNEPGTSSNSQPIVPVLPLQQGPAASSARTSSKFARTKQQVRKDQLPAHKDHRPSTNSEDEDIEDEDDEYGDVEYGPAIKKCTKS